MGWQHGDHLPLVGLHWRHIVWGDDKYTREGREYPWQEPDPIGILVLPHLPEQPPHCRGLGAGDCWSGGFSHLITWTMNDAETLPANLVVYVNYTSLIAGNGVIAGPLTGATSHAW